MNHAPRYTCLVVCAVLAAGGLVTGCASRALPGQGQDSGRYLVNTARGNDENAKLYTDLIEQLIRQDKLYAAHAHLEQRQAEFGQTDQLAALEAEILRRMGQTERAEAMYRQLVKSAYAAEAYHGLGLIEAERDPTQSLLDLRQAVAHAPTNAAMRNDLGYAELLAGHDDRARTEITTAYQLDDKSALAVNNYVLVLLVQGDDQAAQAVAQRSNMAEPRFARLRTRAEQLARVARPTGSAIDSQDSPAAPQPATSSPPTPVAQLTATQTSTEIEAFETTPTAPADTPAEEAADRSITVQNRSDIADTVRPAPTRRDGTSNAIPFSSREIP